MHHSIACSPRSASVATKIPPKTPNICLLEQKGNFVQKKKAIKKQTNTIFSPFLPVYSGCLIVNKDRCRYQKEKLKLSAFKCPLFVGGELKGWEFLPSSRSGLRFQCSEDWQVCTKNTRCDQHWHAFGIFQTRFQCVLLSRTAKKYAKYDQG